MPEAARCEALPTAALDPKRYVEWSRDFADWIVRTQPLKLFSVPSLKLMSEPGETERDFRIRAQQAAREARDESVGRLRERYATKVARLTEKVARGRELVDKEQQQVQQQKLQTAVSFGATMLGALMGRKTVSLSTLGRATTAARGGRCALTTARSTRPSCRLSCSPLGAAWGAARTMTDRPSASPAVTWATIADTFESSRTSAKPCVMAQDICRSVTGDRLPDLSNNADLQAQLKGFVPTVTVWDSKSGERKHSIRVMEVPGHPYFTHEWYMRWLDDSRAIIVRLLRENPARRASVTRSAMRMSSPSTAMSHRVGSPNGWAGQRSEAPSEARVGASPPAPNAPSGQVHAASCAR